MGKVRVKIEDENRRKVIQKSKSYKIKIREPLEKKKKLLVLDIDRTLLFDSSPSAPIKLRPEMHKFLEKASLDYNIGLWSDSKMRRITSLIKRLRMDHQKSYKINFVVCERAVVNIDNGGEQMRVKPLDIVWSQLRQWSPKNTIMVDDLPKNFLMNPQTGLRIKRFDGKRSDRELSKLSRYLKKIASQKDFTVLNHSNWEN
ncbi:ubiquitin-like domain-containing CTD phosphatase 1 [Neocloeon triangulifer]|uniref:ubiquitin-like domain-containing CTD phosphatase 1 n=1 Tax=Neocloeon triangulifer TaxID=2078957 RepID=UPI00286EE716|nr:ubiquitin-like domain-containing CTD phosphatase 1 [Neocloeon triangulifer]